LVNLRPWKISSKPSGHKTVLRYTSEAMTRGRAVW
jgi:hypothetical protein